MALYLDYNLIKSIKVCWKKLRIIFEQNITKSNIFRLNRAMWRCNFFSENATSVESKYHNGVFQEDSRSSKLCCCEQHMCFRSNTWFVCLRNIYYSLPHTWTLHAVEHTFIPFPDSIPSVQVSYRNMFT